MLVQIKQHFQDWGNFYQLLIGILFGLISVWLWFRDRNKSIKIYELAEQTRTLTAILDEFVSPELSAKMEYKPETGGYLLTLTNEGNLLYHFGIISDLGLKTQIQNKAKYVGTKEQVTLFLHYTNEQKMGKVIFHYQDKFSRIYWQTVHFERDDVSISTPEIILKKSNQYSKEQLLILKKPIDKLPLSSELKEAFKSNNFKNILDILNDNVNKIFAKEEFNDKVFNELLEYITNIKKL